LQHLSDQGYVVLKNAFDESELRHAHDLLWEFLTPATGWERGQMQTWSQLGFCMCGLPHWGIIKARGAGQSEVVWFARTRPSVKDVFARIWGTRNLMSSFDGLNVFLPWHHLGHTAKTEAGWLHADQGDQRHGLATIQGFVSLTDQDATTGGLHVIPSSPHLHETWARGHPGSVHNFCMIDPRSFGRELLLMPQQLVTCKAGDLVLWDSRIVHCNTPALQEPTTPENELLRVALYVCLTPKTLASPADLALRLQAYNEGVSCNHWPLFSQQEFEKCFRANSFGFHVTNLDEATDGRRDLIC